jgi:hypothetical protein
VHIWLRTVRVNGVAVVRSDVADLATVLFERDVGQQ